MAGGSVPPRPPSHRRRRRRRRLPSCTPLGPQVTAYLAVTPGFSSLLVKGLFQVSTWTEKYILIGVKKKKNFSHVIVARTRWCPSSATAAWKSTLYIYFKPPPPLINST